MDTQLPSIALPPIDVVNCALTHSVIAQRLLPGTTDRMELACEVMVRTPFIADLIRRGAVDDIKAAIFKGGEAQKSGMQAFDQSLLGLVNTGRIDVNTALTHADSRTDLGLKLRLGAAPR